VPTFQLNSTTPFLLHAGGASKSVIIANQDTTNGILLGSELGIYAAQASGTTGGILTTPEVTEVVPGQSYTFDGDDDIYGIALNGNPVVNVAEKAQNTQVALAGTNLVTPSTPLSFAKQQFFVGVSNNFMVGPARLNQPSYEMQVQVSTNSSATVPFIDMYVIWADSISGFIVAEEEWVLPANAPFGSPNVYTIKGPTKGDTLSMNFVNPDPGFTIEINFAVVVNSRSLLRDRIYTLSYSAPPGYVGPNVHGFADIIASIDGMSVAPGTQARLLPPYAGDVWLWVDQAGNTAANASFVLQAAPTSLLGTAPFFGAMPTGGGPGGSGTVIRFPRAPVLLTYTNSGTSTSTVDAKVIALDERN
jgi:hypothetical protein